MFWVINKLSKIEKYLTEKKIRKKGQKEKFSLIKI